MIARWFFDVLSPAGSQARLSVLVFHRARAEIDPLFPADPGAVTLETQMRWVAAWFNVLPLPIAINGLRDGTLPARAASITFDDGYADNLTIALPILKRLGLNATFFIATGFLDGGRMWNDTVIEAIRRAKVPEIDVPSIGIRSLPVNTLEAKRRAIQVLLPQLKYLEQHDRDDRALEIADAARARLPSDLMLTSEQVHQLSVAGMTIGAHTVNHPILAILDASSARREIYESKARVEAIIGKEAELFAYPNGKPGKDYALHHSSLVREAGFVAAVSTSPGAASARSDPYQLPRFTPWDRSAWRYAARLARNLRQPGLEVKHQAG